MGQGFKNRKRKDSAAMQNLVITDSGEELVARLIAGTATAAFTKVSASDHDYSRVELKSLTGLEGIRQTVAVSGVSRAGAAMVEVLAAMDNSGVEAGYYTRALGLYAEDGEGDEVLFGVSIETENPFYLPPFCGKTVSSITYRLNVKVDNSAQIKVEMNPGAYPTIEQVEWVQGAIGTHASSTIYSEGGIHGLRYFEGALQVREPSGEWADVGGGGGIPPSNVINPKIKAGDGQLTITWGDPGDTIVEGKTLCTWKGTKLVQKVGGFPESIKDGEVLVDNQTLDAYKDDGFVVQNLTNGAVYYFALFPYADTGAANANVRNRISGAPQPYKIMTVNIDLSNRDPLTSVTYADDAVGMEPKSAAWDGFFGHYPVLFKDGAEVGKLNPGNFAQFEDGSAADITSGEAGDVMVAFPRRGVRISTVGDTLKVSMTDDPDSPDFKYYAHERGDSRREAFYLGAYKGYVGSSKLRSLSGKTPTGGKTMGAFRGQAHAMGEGYENSGFYQLTFRQVMYILKYKNLDSQAAVGQGYVNATAVASTGGTNTKGMDYGDTFCNSQVKLFGLEDFWGNIWEWIDGVATDSTHNILTATDGFNDSATGYIIRGQGGDISTAYMSKPQGTSETGFLGKEASGSKATYFCDMVKSAPSCIGLFGGYRRYEDGAGAFCLYIGENLSASGDSLGSRLMFL